MKLNVLFSLIFGFLTHNVIAQEPSDTSSLKAAETSPATNPQITQASPSSSWIGATLAYNIGGEDAAENVVGAARLKLGFVKQLDGKPFNLFVIGNFAKITSGVSEDMNENINDLIQSNQGLSVGISPIYTFNFNKVKETIEDEKNLFRAYSTLNYKVNGYKDVGTEKKSINLNQFRGTLGLEFEGLKIDKGGYFNISTEYIFTAVDGSLYNEIFGEQINQFSTFELSLIIPIPGIFGFITTIDYSVGAKPVYQFGFIIKKPVE